MRYPHAFVAPCVAAVIQTAGAGPIRATPPPETVLVAPLGTAPVFFERFYDAYAIDENLALMRRGRVAMGPHGVTDIDGFAWAQSRSASDSWMLDIEEMLYLLPFIASDKEDDRRFAVAWFDGWDAVHAGGARPNGVAWDGMTTGIRAMVLVCFLEREERRTDGGISEQLRESLATHRRVLAEGAFDFSSNHGMWEAMGLVELGRALHDPVALELGLSRLESLAATQVSVLGFHMEHAPLYHFAFLAWLDQETQYLESVLQSPWPGLDVLRDVRDRMIAAGYFLQAHDGTVIPIGDSFRRPVPAAYRISREHDQGSTMMDAAAGYGCYKESGGPRRGRHVVFNVQPAERPFPSHFHDDALAVVVYYRGESIFGDAGAYDYGISQHRRFVVSGAAHNVVAPAADVFATDWNCARTAFARDVVLDEGPTFRARRDYATARLDRAVTVSRDAASVVIDDDVVGDGMVMLWNLGAEVTSVERRPAPAVADGTFDARWILRTRAGRTFELSVVCAHGGAVRVAEKVRGGRRRMVGWYSPSYRRIVPSSAIVVEFDAPETLHIRTEVLLVDDTE